MQYYFQKPLMELYKSLVELKNKIPEMQGKDLTLEEIKIVPYLPEHEAVEKLISCKDKSSGWFYFVHNLNFGIFEVICYGMSILLNHTLKMWA